MRTVSHSIRRGRNRAAVILLAGTMAAGAGITAPIAPTASAAPKCNYVSQDNRPELGESSEGDAVAQAQCLIGTRSGYPKTFDVSGIFGPETTEAVLWVQNCNEIKESGYTDEDTWKVLYRAKKGCGKTKPSDKPGDKPGDQSGGKPDGKPGGKQDGKPSSKPSGKPAAKPSGKPAKEPSAKPPKDPKPSAKPSKAASTKPSKSSGKAVAPEIHPPMEPGGYPM